MKRSRYTASRTLGIVVAGVVVASVLGAPNAQAQAPGPRPAGYSTQVADAAAAALADRVGLDPAEAMRRLESQPARVELGERLAGKLGSRAAGIWLDQVNDTVVVNVLDTAAADTVRAAGADARVVSRSTAELEDIRDRLAGLKVTGTAVGIDVEANQVLVHVDKSAAGKAQPAGLLGRARAFGSAVRVERVDGSFSTLISGGFPMLAATGGFCSLGFSTTANTGITAGHCTRAVAQWFDGSNGLFYGQSIAASYPGNDFGLIVNSGGLPQPGNVYLYNGGFQDIVTAANPVPNLIVCKSGAATGLTCGVVLAIGQVVCYPDGCVGDLAAGNAAAAPGDSGGPWFNGAVGVGLTSGGGGGLTFFQPVVEGLLAYGVWVF